MSSLFVVWVNIITHRREIHNLQGFLKLYRAPGGITKPCMKCGAIFYAAVKAPLSGAEQMKSAFGGFTEANEKIL